MNDLVVVVKLTLKDDDVFIEGGDLQNKYDLVQFHLHWGVDNSVGSEHRLDGYQFPLEV